MIKPLHTYPHQELIAACRQNNRKAQMELYNNYYKTMYHTANRILNDPTEAEDVMQEAFMDAFQKIDQLAENASFGAWLKRIVINRSLDLIKRKKLEQAYLEQSMPEDVQLLDEEPDVACKIEEVKAAMKLIPDQYRVVLSLHLFEGMDYEEMAQIMNLEYNNVKTRYFRARQRLLDEILNKRNQLGKKEVWHVEN